MTESKSCAQCQTPFIPVSSSQIYCSARCNRDAYEARRQGRATATPEEIAKLETKPEELSSEEWMARAAAWHEQFRPLRPVPDEIRTTRREDMGFDTEQQGFALFSDLHWGSFVDSRVTAGLALYDRALQSERLERWRDGLLRFTQMDQYLLPLKVLNLAALGDDIEGHGRMFATQRSQMTDSVGFILLEFIDHMSDILISLLERYEHINVFKVRGNHGRMAYSAKEDYAPDNFELIAWNNIADRVSKSTGGEWSMTRNGIRILRGGRIDFSISPAFMMFLKVFDFNVALRHGDGVGPVARTYTGLIDNKLRLNAIVGQMINYYFIAHHHQPESVEHEIGGEAVVNGCFVGPSQLSVSMSRPAANIPSQEFFLFHPKHGITHRHRIRLASANEMRSRMEWLGDSGLDIDESVV